MTLDELYAAANVFCRRNWGVDYTGTIELVNRKWKKWLACFIATDAGIIRMSSRVNSDLSSVRVLDNLHHELVHWWLWTLGQPFDDEDYEFVAECVRVGASLSGTKSAKAALIRYIARFSLEERFRKRHEGSVA